MRTILFALISITLLLASCNHDENPINKQETSASQMNQFYGVKHPNGATTRGVAQRDKLWHNGTVIKVKFLNGSPEYRDKVKNYAAEWENYANIKFDYVENEKANVRIGFDWNNQQHITWSYTGVECKYEPNQNMATANFAYWDSSQEYEIKGDVLRVFGQILGLELEHRHLNFDAGWTHTIQDYWTGEIEDIPWSDLKEYVFDPLSGSNLIQTNQFDENSIMIWPFTRKYAKNTARDFNYDLSEMDKQFIAQLYPKSDPIDDSVFEFDPVFFAGKIHDGVLVWDVDSYGGGGMVMKIRSLINGEFAPFKTEGPDYMQHLGGSTTQMEFPIHNIGYNGSSVDRKDYIIFTQLKTNKKIYFEIIQSKRPS